MTQSDIVSEFIHAVRVDQVCTNVVSCETGGADVVHVVRVSKLQKRGKTMSKV